MQRKDKIQDAWRRLISNGKSESDNDTLPQYIEASTFADRYLAESQASTSTAVSTSPDDTDGVPFAPLRSLHYSLTLGVLPSEATVQGWVQSTQRARVAYDSARREAYRAPDGSLPDGIEELADGSGAIHGRQDWTQNNPLSLETDVRWAKMRYAAQSVIR